MIFFQDPNVRWVTLGMMIISATAALIGVFTYLRKRALVGDAISHAILPGICLSFMISGSKNPMILLLGAFVTGWISTFLIDMLINNTKLKPENIITLILSVFYGLGILLLTSIQGSGNAAQSGLDKFLFGKAASLVYDDVVLFELFALLILIIILLFYQPFKIAIFDRDFAKAKGYPVRALELLNSSLTVLGVALGMQAVGVILMAALLISPPAAARYWTNNLSKMLIIAVLIGMISGFMGAYISYTLPKMPTGPWVVIILSLIAFISILFGNRNGVIAKIKHQKANQNKILEENILKCFYHLGEHKNTFFKTRTLSEIKEKRFFKKNKLKIGISKLIKKDMICKTNENLFKLTPKGKNIGQRITKIHRLWEIYLSKYMHLPQDHIHEDAEAIEHIITPEIEKALEEHLQYPLKDPHNSPIPYIKQD